MQSLTPFIVPRLDTMYIGSETIQILTVQFDLPMLITVLRLKFSPYVYECVSLIYKYHMVNPFVNDSISHSPYVKGCAE